MYFWTRIFQSFSCFSFFFTTFFLQPGVTLFTILLKRAIIIEENKNCYWKCQGNLFVPKHLSRVKSLVPRKKFKKNFSCLNTVWFSSILFEYIIMSRFEFKISNAQGDAKIELRFLILRYVFFLTWAKKYLETFFCEKALTYLKRSLLCFYITLQLTLKCTWYPWSRLQCCTLRISPEMGQSLENFVVQRWNDGKTIRNNKQIIKYIHILSYKVATNFIIV